MHGTSQFTAKYDNRESLELLVKYCHKLFIFKEKRWFDESMSATFCMEDT